MQLRAEGGYLDSRFLAAIDVLKQHGQGSPKEKKVLMYHLLLSRVVEVRHLQSCLAVSAPAGQCLPSKALEEYVTVEVGRTILQAVPAS